MAGYIIKYSASVYQSKINSLESCTNQLTAHLNTLEGYKNQLHSFWEDDDAVRYMSQITDQIIKVRHAMEEVANLKRLYQENVDKMTGGAAAIDDIIDDIDRAINTSANVTSAKADVADVIIPG